MSDKWNNNGLVVVEIEGRQKFRMPLDSAAEFAAVAAVLRESPVFLYKDGSIRTGAEVAEDEA